MELPRQLGEYLLLEQLGRGGMGAVYLARRQTADPARPPLAIKTLHPHLSDHVPAVARFVHEAKLARLVESPHVVKIIEGGKFGDTLYIAMEYVKGISVRALLDQLITERRDAPIGIAVRIAADVLSGLDAIHEVRDHEGRHLGALHRDVSPKNVLVGEDGVARLIDLGIGRSLLKTSKTATGALVGTRGYLAPEQATGQEIDHRVDIYQAGILLFELLTLRAYQPVSGAEREVVIEAAAKPSFLLPSTHRSEIPFELDRIVARALALNPDRRFQSAREFRDALLELADVPATARELIATLPAVRPVLRAEEATRSAADQKSTDVVEPATVPEKREAPRRPWLIPAASVALASVVALSAWMTVRSQSIERAPSRSALAQPAPDERAPTERAPNERAPNERAPNERAPNERAPNERAPTVRAPTEPAPLGASPAAARPAEPIEPPRPTARPLPVSTPSVEERAPPRPAKRAARVPEPPPPVVREETAESILLRLSRFGSDARARMPQKAAAIERILGEAARVRDDPDRLTLLERELHALAGSE